jgi:hypothetical protein
MGSYGYAFARKEFWSRWPGKRVKIPATQAWAVKLDGLWQEMAECMLYDIPFIATSYRLRAFLR